MIFVDVSQLEMCLVDNSTVTSLIFKGSTDPLPETIKVRSKLARNQCQLTIDELEGQEVVDMRIENATNPVNQHYSKSFVLTPIT